MIISGILKALGKGGIELILKILNTVWEKEKIPTDWNTGLIVLIYRKGNKRNCNKYRGLTTSNVVTKTHERVLENKLR